MKHVLKPLAAAVVASSVLLTGCMGKFALTDKVYTWNKKVDSNRWINEGIFLVFVVLPVYGITLLADGVIFNSIDWWTGNNPIAAGEQRRVEGADGSIALMTMREDGAIDLQVDSANGDKSTFTLVKNEDSVTVLDQRGLPVSVGSF